MKKFEVCVQATKVNVFTVEAVDEAAAMDAAMELAETFDWDSVPIDSWFDIDKWYGIDAVREIGKQPA